MSQPVAPTSPQQSLDLNTQFITACLERNLAKLQQLNKHPNLKEVIKSNVAIKFLVPSLAKANEVKLIDFLLNECICCEYFIPTVEKAFIEACKYSSLDTVRYFMTSPNLIAYNTTATGPNPQVDPIKAQQVSLSPTTREGFEHVCRYGKKELLQFFLEELPPERRPPADIVARNAVYSLELTSPAVCAYILEQIASEDWHLDFQSHKVKDMLRLMIERERLQTIEFLFEPQKYVSAKVAAKISPLPPADGFTLARSAARQDRLSIVKYLENSQFGPQTDKEKKIWLSQFIHVGLASKSSKVLEYLITKYPHMIFKQPKLLAPFSKTNWFEQDHKLYAVWEQKKLEHYIGNPIPVSKSQRHKI